MDSSTTTARIYPSAPLEAVVTHEQQQKLLPPAPPSYEQTMTTPTPISHTTTSPSQGPTVVVVTQPATVAYGPHPVDVTCPFCHNHTRTRIRFRPNNRTHIIAALLCLFQLYCCICLPYCIDSCLDTQHFCGMCDQYLGTYHRQ